MKLIFKYTPEYKYIGNHGVVRAQFIAIMEKKTKKKMSKDK